MTKTAQIGMPDMTEPNIYKKVYENDNYTVNVVRMPDMAFNTYGIINKDTDVIEQIQPNLYNAKYIADQFNKWLTAGPDDQDEYLDFLNMGIGGNNKAN